MIHTILSLAFLLINTIWNFFIIKSSIFNDCIVFHHMTTIWLNQYPHTWIYRLFLIFHTTNNTVINNLETKTLQTPWINFLRPISRITTVRPKNIHASSKIFAIYIPIALQKGWHFKWCREPFTPILQDTFIGDTYS